MNTSKIQARLYLTITDKSSVALYRNDGLAAIDNANGPKLDIIRKDIIALFKEDGLSITIETNLIGTYFLPVTFNLETKKYFTFRKANNTLLCINTFSNYPPTIMKQLPKLINKRISDLSLTKEEFGNIISFFIIITMYIDSLVTNKLKIKVNKTRQHMTQNLLKTYTACCKLST